jgi:hypothetical protein
MSFDRCRTCKHVGLCTFPKSCVITDCDEFEDMDSAPAHDWDFAQLLKLWTRPEDQVRAE